ncbi:Peptidoglycan-recognition protein LB [Papilio xuthus]|uniref:Peptidoglycan-recognition protein n=1 Tax=Papilio xuthus TaxID=66420 RepID=A0A194Q679_PAPXU|nr:Peptidoglycan-recognition protein LB [Papilio xuthus]
MLFILVISMTLSAQGFPKPYLTKHFDYDTFTFKTRSDWGSKPATSVRPLTLPVPYVIIHHSYTPPACQTSDQCEEAMRSMQEFHQVTRNWVDIGYNFAVGGDGVVYEGRGWTNIGAHASEYISVSIGIVLIGDWVSSVPPAHQLQTAKKLIAKGVELGYISRNYKLIGHRQVKETECPGQALFNEISTWDRFEPNVKRKS